MTTESLPIPSRRRKRWLGFLASLLAAALAVSFAGFLDLNDHRGALRSLLLDTIGLDVEINGRIEHQWSNGLYLSARAPAGRPLKAAWQRICKFG